MRLRLRGKVGRLRKNGDIYMNKKYDVVVIDTGAEKAHFRLASCNIECMKITRRTETDGLTIENLTDGGDDVGHGTAVCSIVFVIILSHFGID